MESCSTPECREDLIKRINTKITLKTFLTALGIVIMAMIAIAGIAYNSYSEGKKSMQQQLERQTEALQEARQKLNIIDQQKLTAIEVNQHHVMKKQDEFRSKIDTMEEVQRRILEQIIKIREHQKNND